MDLRDTPEEAAFRAEVRVWLEANVPTELSGPRSNEEQYASAWLEWSKKLADAGYAGLTWPKDYGGSGAPYPHQAIFLEETARAEAPQHMNVIGLGMAGPTIIAHGTEEQKSRYLPKILSADEIWCQGFSEPGAGSDLASARTSARLEGDRFVVDGQKVWSSFAHIADWCILVTRSDPESEKHAGLTYMLVDMHSPGVEVRPLRQITGESEFNELFIEEARIPQENIVGREGEGWAVAITTLMHERATLAFGLQVSVQIALRELVDTARHARGLDGAVATEDPVIRQHLAQLLIESEVLRLNAYRGLSAIMRSGVPGPEGSLGKWHWSEVNQSLTELAMEIAGPRAMLSESEGNWSYRFLRSRANSIEGGTTEILKNIVAERVLGLPRMR